MTNRKSYGRGLRCSKFGCAETAAVPCQWRQRPSEAVATACGGGAEVSVRGAPYLPVPAAGRCGWECAGAGDAYVRVARSKAARAPGVTAGGDGCGRCATCATRRAQSLPLLRHRVRRDPPPPTLLEPGSPAARRCWSTRQAQETCPSRPLGGPHWSQS